MSYDAVPDSKPVEAVENVKDEKNEDAVATLVEKPKCCCLCWNFSGRNRRAYVTVLVLFLINLLNYMDRQTIPGLLDGIQKYFGIQNNDSVAGLLQTVFICSYMLLAPVFGFLGDRYKRKYIMAAGILVWSGTVFASTLLNKDSFWWFLALRGVVGIGEASYSTIAPTVIGDLFTGDMRTKMLSVFYFAIPVGSGLGYIVGTTVAGAFDHKWQWGLRATPILGAVCVLLCVFIVHEPKRGAIERGENPNAVSASNVHNTSSWLTDLKYLTTVKSFIWLTLGFTCVAFVTGALAFWAPKFLLYASHTQGIDESETIVNLKVGGITCAAGIIGVWLGAEIAQRYRVQNRKADALVCAVGLLSSAPFLYVCLLLADKNIKVTYALIFFGEVLLFMNWAPVGDMVLYIIIPARRSTASAVQILVSHLLGDAGSPWLVGQVFIVSALYYLCLLVLSLPIMPNISDLIRGSKTTDAARATSMEYSLLMTTFISVLGGFCFIMCSFYLEKDRDKADEYNRTHDDESSLLSSVAADNYPSNCCATQTLEYDDDDDDHLIGVEPDTPTTPTPSEGKTLVVPVDVHSSVPVQEIHGNHVM